MEKNSYIASRKSSEIVLSYLIKNNLNLLGGSADLTGSNNTLVEKMKVIEKDNFDETIYTGELENIVWQQL